MVKFTKNWIYVCLLALLVGIVFYWEMRLKPEVLFWQLRGALKDHNDDRADIIAHRMMKIRSRTYALARRGFRQSQGQDRSTWLIYFGMEGASARDFLESEYERCESDYERLMVLKAVLNTGDATAFQRLGELLLSARGRVLRSAVERFKTIRGASGPFFTELDKIEDWETVDTGKLKALFDEWWRQHGDKINWRSEEWGFEVVSPSEKQAGHTDNCTRQ